MLLVVVSLCVVDFSLSPFWKLLAITGNRPGHFVALRALRVLLCDPKSSFTPRASPLFGNLMRETTARCLVRSIPSVTTEWRWNERERGDRKYNGDGVKVCGRRALSLLSTWISYKIQRCMYTPTGQTHSCFPWPLHRRWENSVRGERI